MNSGGKSDKFVVRVVDSLKSEDVDPREGIVPADLEVSAEEALAALHASEGSEKVFKAFPQFLDVDSWLPVANFTVCSKFGSARYLDLWDVDHFDGLTNLQRNLDECRAWFSDKGFDSWGSGQTRSGRINCYFTAPQAGGYICTARLQSYAGGAVVECLIDGASFGPLSVNGIITQPHPCNLSAGGHHFRIRQVAGSFFFLSLTVWRA